MHRLSIIALAALLVPSLALAQSTPVRDILAMIQADNGWTMDQQVSICEVPAPPFRETQRSAEYRRRFEALGLQKVRTDAVGNVYGERPGSGRGPTIVLAGHLDTVFPESTDVRVRREGGRLVGRGITDNCRGLAVVLAVARAFQRVNPQHDARIVFVGNVGEEGPGNLRGVRHLFEQEMKEQVDYFIAVDGAGLGITSRAVGSNRYRVMFKGPGGHSYGAFGIPNPIHALGRAIAKIDASRVASVCGSTGAQPPSFATPAVRTTAGGACRGIAITRSAPTGSLPSNCSRPGDAPATTCSGWYPTPRSSSIPRTAAPSSGPATGIGAGSGV